MRKRFIWEAEGDEGGTATDTSTNTNADNAAGGGDENTTAGNDNAEEGGDDDEGDDEDEPSDSDFSIDASDDTGDEDAEGGEEDSGDDDSSGSGLDSGGDGEPSAEEDNQNDMSKQKSILDKEKEIFSILSPAEQRVKNKELKTQFMNLYNNCNSIMEKINDIGSDIDCVSPQLKRTVSILYQIKQNIYDYLFDLYDSKGYFENKEAYYTNLAMLNSVKKVLIAIDKSYDPNNTNKN
jgi:hypothetical protein